MHSVCQFSDHYCHFQVTFGIMSHFRVTSGHLSSRESFPLTLLPPPASYSLVGTEMYSTFQLSAVYSHFQVTSGQITSLPGHFRSPEVT